MIITTCSRVVDAALKPQQGAKGHGRLNLKASAIAGRDDEFAEASDFAEFCCEVFIIVRIILAFNGGTEICKLLGVPEAGNGPKEACASLVSNTGLGLRLLETLRTAPTSWNRYLSKETFSNETTTNY